MEYKPLSDVITLQRGFDLPTSKREKGNVPVIGATGIVGWHNDAKLKGPVVTIGRSGVVGGSQWFQEEAWPLNTTMFVKDFKGNNPKFVYYALKTIDFTSYDSGSAQPSLNRNYISGLPFPCPSREEQNRIAHILGSLDDKIEANKKIARISLSLALSLYSSHESENSNQYQLNDLFADFIGGDWGKERAEGGLCPVYAIRGSDIPSLQLGGCGILPLRFIKKNSLERRSLSVGDVVVEGSGGSPTQCTGRPVLITKELLDTYPHPLVATNFCKIIKPLSADDGVSIYLSILTAWQQGDLWQYETGTTGIKNLNFSLFASQKKILLQNDLNGIIQSISRFGKENIYLSEVKNKLIRRLIG